MAERLKSITKRIPSSLLLRAGVIAVLWLLAKAAWPLGFTSLFWLFLLLATLFYFVPLFRPASLLVPFLLFLLLALILPAGILTALVLGLLFGLLLGIKDLLVVDRETAYEILAFGILFLADISFYSLASAYPAASLIFAPVLPALLYFLLVRVMPWRDPPHAAPHPAPALLEAGLVGEAALVLAILPLDYLYQAGLLFMFMVLAVFVDVKFKEGTLTAKTVLSGFLPLAIASGLVLLLNSWRI